jgi:hypothetical protein
VAQSVEAAGGPSQAGVGGAIGAVCQIELGAIQNKDDGAVLGNLDSGAIGNRFLGVPFRSGFQMLQGLIGEFRKVRASRCDGHSSSPGSWS